MELVGQVSVEKLFKRLNQISRDQIVDKRLDKSLEELHIPLRDLIEVKYNEDGSIRLFGINPKLVRIMFIKDLNDECQLRSKPFCSLI